MKTPVIPRRVRWSNGMVLEPVHFERMDSRAGDLARLAALAGDPWPWGYTRCDIDETALVSGNLRVQCEGILPDGTVFEQETLTRKLPDPTTGASLSFSVQAVDESGRTSFMLAPNDTGAQERALPAVRLVERSGIWGQEPEWSAPTLLIGDEHPLRNDAAARLGALAALGAGFLTTLRMPGAEERAAARRLGQVALELVPGGRDHGDPASGTDRGPGQTCTRGDTARARSTGSSRGIRTPSARMGPGRSARIASPDSVCRRKNRIRARTAVPGDRAANGRGNGHVHRRRTTHRTAAARGGGVKAGRSDDGQKLDRRGGHRGTGPKSTKR